MSDNEKLILFDGVCNLCNGFVKFIIRRDKKGKIRFAPLQSDAAKNSLHAFGHYPEKSDTVIYISGNKFFDKSSAVLNILKDLGRGWQLMFVFIILPPFIRDWFYDLVAKNRYRIFGRSDTCMIPTSEIKNRFIS
jgi:predicted DCC family thiol-disulfide oxidoreductase YuxK